AATGSSQFRITSYIFSPKQRLLYAISSFPIFIKSMRNNLKARQYSGLHNTDGRVLVIKRYKLALLRLEQTAHHSHEAVARLLATAGCTRANRGMSELSGYFPPKTLSIRNVGASEPSRHSQ
ncbi:uncharacterized protein N7479_007280, partial [Penicillium vulpinum]|uniref:uncharacterized protein n=1 Tax=Penicillium vulpinum TaxID=29845 RepID=UPI0025483E59